MLWILQPVEEIILVRQVHNMQEHGLVFPTCSMIWCVVFLEIAMHLEYAYVIWRLVPETLFAV